MKKLKLVFAIISFLMAFYFLIKRRDIIIQLFKLNLDAIPVGKLILPIILFIVGVFFLTIKYKKNDD